MLIGSFLYIGKLVEWWRDDKMPFLLKDPQMLAPSSHQTGEPLFLLLAFGWAVSTSSFCSQSLSSPLLSCAVLFLISSRSRHQCIKSSGICTFSVMGAVVVTQWLGCIVEKDPSVQLLSEGTFKPSPDVSPKAQSNPSPSLCHLEPSLTEVLGELHTICWYYCL